MTKLRALVLWAGTVALVLSATPSNATTDYLFFEVNGDSTVTTMVQGDTLAWGANCAVGASMEWVIGIDLDEAGWDFCARLAQAIETHAAARWCDPVEIFGVGA